jgi:hypothetical protein
MAFDLMTFDFSITSDSTTKPVPSSSHIPPSKHTHTTTDKKISSSLTSPSFDFSLYKAEVT